MAKRLTAIKVANLKKAGYFADGDNLYFRVAPGGTRGWIFRFTMAGRTRDMGLGGYPEIGLSAARDHAEECRKLIKKGLDPIEQRRAARAEAVMKEAADAMAKAKIRTFDECAHDYIKAHDAAWRNAKHRAQWSSTLKTYVSPVFGDLAVADVDNGLVFRALQSIWTSKPETASRVRARVEAVLDWAGANGYRTGENPARWKGQLKHQLPPINKIKRVKHHAALPYTEIAAFMAEIHTRRERAARALEFTILTAARTGEALRATWDEIDLQAKIWTLPGERMKGGLPHRVPLSDAALAVLKRENANRINDYVFPGGRVGRPLSDMTLLMLLRRIDFGPITTHGFRSTFRDWAAECTAFPNHVVEMALAHAIPSAVEAAYRRGDLFEKRRFLMQAWAEFCATTDTGADLVALRRSNPFRSSR